jgi:hypothetical protein
VAGALTAGAGGAGGFAATFFLAHPEMIAALTAIVTIKSLVGFINPFCTSIVTPFAAAVGILFAQGSAPWATFTIL